MKNYKNTSGTEIIEYSSFDDMLNDIKDPHGSTATYGDAKWSGTKDYAEAMSLAFNGWTAIRPAVDSIMSRIRDRIADRTAPVFNMSHDVCGMAVDMAAFMSGQPECMIMPIPEPSRNSGKVVRIHYNAVGNCHVKAEAMQERGAAILALVDALNVLGVNAEIWTEISVNKGRRKGSVLVNVKNAHESVDVNRLMFALGSPSYLRRLTVSVMAKHALVGVQTGGDCSGVALHLVEDVAADVVVRSEHSNDDRIAKDPDGWILGELARLGFDVEPK